MKAFDNQKADTIVVENLAPELSSGSTRWAFGVIVPGQQQPGEYHDDCLAKHPQVDTPSLLWWTLQRWWVCSLTFRWLAVLMISRKKRVSYPCCQ